jgi:transketolase
MWNACRNDDAGALGRRLHCSLTERERAMEADKNPLEAVRAMMIDTFEKSRSATQSYLDMFENTMRGIPNTKPDQVAEFKAYIERQVAANHAFVDKLLRAKDFQEAFRIHTEHLQSQLKAATEDATKFGSKLTAAFKPPTG